MTFRAVGFDFFGVVYDTDAHPRAFDPNVLDIARELKARGLPVAIYSNYASGPDRLTERGLPSDIFDLVETSSRTGLIKPDPAAFRYLARVLGVKLGELIFIDDTPYNLSSALQVGYQAITFYTPNRLRTALTQLGVL
jgi:putative hydrolase of the HAD superfamily